MKISRRDILKGLGGAVVGGTLGSASLFLARDGIAAAGPAEQTAELPWKYKKLDPQVVAENGYADYYKGACCYGVFEAIVSELRKSVGAPYTTFPSDLLVFGEGGIAGIASVCGALNGASMAIFLIAGGMDKKKREPAAALTRDLFTWYEQTQLPDYKPRNPKYEIVKSVSRSSLCHASVSNWCKTAHFKSFSKERSERCAWLTASVAKHTAELLNSHADGAFKAGFKLSSVNQTCRSCHDQGSTMENTRGMSDCGGCHFRGPVKHSKI